MNRKNQSIVTTNENGSVTVLSSTDGQTKVTMQVAKELKKRLTRATGGKKTKIISRKKR